MPQPCRNVPACQWLQKELKARFQEMEGHELDVVLAKENATIYFTETHVFDLGKVIAVDEDGRPKL